MSYPPISVSIILLNYNTLFYTEQCINSIISSTHIDYEIIVVENNSNDKYDIKKLEEKFEGVKVIISPENLGFGAGNNLGVRNASGKYIVILNNDTIVYPCTIDNIKRILDEYNGMTIITGSIEDSNGKQQHSGGQEPNFIYEFLRFSVFLIKFFHLKRYRNYYYYPGDNENKKELDWVTGCFFAMGKNFYQKLKGFDENMFMYFEDVEFHKRARLDGGEICFRPELKIKHFVAQSSNTIKYQAIRSQYINTIYYFSKHRSKSYALTFFLLTQTVILFNTIMLSIVYFLSFLNSRIYKKLEIYKNLILAFK